MPLLTLLVLFLLAPIMDQNSVQFLKATVGGSIPIMCSLPVPGNPLRVQWFYWQEDESNNTLYHWNIDGKTEPVPEKYKNRVHALNTEFSSGNISIRLDNVTVGDDGKKFWARACVYDGQRSFCTPSEQMCDSELQVSALYTDLHLTVDNTALVATCTAQGGYPKPQVSWTGQNKSSGAHLDLQDAETFTPQDSEKTFSVNSSVSVKELQSVTCIVYNPRCNQKISKTSEVDAPDENQQRKHNTILIPVIIFVIIIIIIFLCVFLWRKHTSPGKSGRNETEEAVRLSENGENQAKPLQTDKDTTAAGADAEATQSTDIEEHAAKKSPQKEAEM